jgi:hypothetical protein
MATGTRPLQPPELGALVELSERPRTHNWSLRAALCRYAQPEPVRVSRLLDLVRRIEFALADHSDVLRKRGDEVWQAVNGNGGADADTGAGTDDRVAYVVGVLRAASEIDRLGDRLAAWAVAREGDRPDAEVDAVTDRVRDMLADVGVPEQERPRPPRGRG